MEQISVTKGKLKDILDMGLLESHIAQLSKCVQVPITLLDTSGEIIFASSWIELCEVYIRGDSALGATCRDVCSRLEDYGPGLFKCPNGLMMYGVPIQVKDSTVAYLVLSQFLMEGSEDKSGIDALNHLNIDKGKINEIMREVPILNSKKIEDIIGFMKNLVTLLHDMIDRRLRTMELEEELLQNYEELEASYQDVSELNDRLSMLNVELVRKNHTVNQNKRRYLALIEKMKQGILILESRLENSENTPSFKILDTNKTMTRILNYEGNTSELDKVECGLLKFIVLNARGQFEKVEKKTFYCEKNDKYYDIEYEKLSENELMACIQDVTELHRKFQWQKKQIWDIVTAMGKLVEERDLYTADHQKKVAILATGIATSLGIEKKQIESIFIASLLHDIGKISIPSEILTKPDKLSYIEYELMKTHVEKAYEILKEINFGMPVEKIIKQHHEKINGSGYPDKLKDKEIMIESKIIAVADVYEAITSHRPYRPSLGTEYAEKHLREEKGILYDADVVEACIEVAKGNHWNIENIYSYLYRDEVVQIY